MTVMDRLDAEVRKKQAPVVVGLDPQLSLIPDPVKRIPFIEYGRTLEGAAEAIRIFNEGIIDAVADIVPAVKPQIAMYEQFGIPGLQAYLHTIEYAKSRGLLVIGDVKRGDIGSTSAAYSAAHIGRVDIDGESVPVFDEDFATVNPYLGTDGIRPFLEDCKAFDKGLFVLVKTSNPSSGEIQDQRLHGRKADAKLVYEHVAGLVETWGKELPGERYSSVGAVVGATYPKLGAKLRGEMPDTFFLVPGYGAQGAKAKDLTGYFDADGGGAIVNSSRGIIGAWQKPEYAGMPFATAARMAALDMIEDLRRALS